MIYRIMGFLLLIETAMLMCCGGVSLFYKEDDLNSFLLSSAITAFVGVIMLAIGRGAEKSLNRRDGYVIVSVAWIAFSFFGMLPYYIGGYIPSVTDAFFETMSGFSSTGATIMNNIESMPHGILFWRAMNSVDRRSGNCILYDCRSSDFRYGRYSGICRRSQRADS